MARAWRFDIGAGFLKKTHVSPLSMLGHCFDVVFIGTLPSHTSPDYLIIINYFILLDSGVNE